VPAAWFRLALELVRTTPGFSPPVAARAFGYAGVALHEALAPGSLAGRLNGLTRPRVANDAAYHWPTVANSALATILRCLFPTASPAMAAAIDDLERRHATPATAVYRRSAARGADVARHVFAWSSTDGGHEGFLRNFPPYSPPAGAGLWVPTPPGFMPALQPFWGANRAFVLTSGEPSTPGPPPYSEQPGSAFHSEALECYRATLELSPEQEAIARFWSDDPGRTATPAGHWISIPRRSCKSATSPSPPPPRRTRVSASRSPTRSSPAGGRSTATTCSAR
jgi:hypothetical protein